MCDSCLTTRTYQAQGFPSFDAWNEALEPLTDWQDAARDASMADAARRTPTRTADILAALAAHNVPAYIEDLAGGCFAIMAPLTPNSDQSDAADYVLVNNSDAGLPFVGSGLTITRYGYDDRGDTVEYDPIYFRQDDDDTPADVIADVTSRVWHALKAAQNVTITLPRASAEFLSCLTDSDDDPSTAHSFGYTTTDWETARAALASAVQS